jgi:hypothetical protein
MRESSIMQSWLMHRKDDVETHLQQAAYLSNRPEFRSLLNTQRFEIKAAPNRKLG